jgi:hypothetical protein
MQIRNFLNRKIIAVTIFMGVILYSIVDPIPDIPGIFNQQLNLNKSANYQCLAGDIPKNDAVIFFENPYDPAANTNTIALYYRAQFFLAPRILHLKNNMEQSIGQTEAQWFIGTNLKPQQAEQFSDNYQLNLINVCGQFSLFHKD